MPTQVSLRPHQSALKMLDAHDSLRRIYGPKATVSEDFLVLDIRDVDDDSLVGRGLEALEAVPGHVLDGEHCAIAQDFEVEGAVGTVQCQRGLS